MAIRGAFKNGKGYQDRGLKATFRQPPIATIPASFPLILTILAALATFPLCYVAGPSGVPATPQAGQIETRIQAEGLDKHHRALPFTVYILSQTLSWKLESVTNLEGEHAFLNLELTAAINRARDVFCIGTASWEGATQMEEERAAQRARKLAQWIGSVIRDPKKTRLFSVNAGQYNGPQELHSAEQRKAIVITTEGHAEDVDMGDALNSGLQKKQQEYPFIYSLLHHYSKSSEWLGLLNAPTRRAPRRPAWASTQSSRAMSR